MERREDKKPDLRDGIYPPMPGPDVEPKDEHSPEMPSSMGELPEVTPDPTKVPEGQTTKE